jgi:hypothetical protein
MRPHPLPSRRAAVRALASASVLATAALTAACGGDTKGGSGGSASASCAPDSGTTVTVAVAEFIKTAEPTPQRYLMAAGTDSALPERATLALQDKGPTYFYPADPAARKQVRDKLESVGDFNTLLVVLHGVSQPTEDSAEVRLGGHYVSGKADGMSTAPRSYAFVCDTSGWRMTTPRAPDRPLPKPPTDTTAATPRT